MADAPRVDCKVLDCSQVEFCKVGGGQKTRKRGLLKRRRRSGRKVKLFIHSLTTNGTTIYRRVPTRQYSPPKPHLVWREEKRGCASGYLIHAERACPCPSFRPRWSWSMRSSPGPPFTTQPTYHILYCMCSGAAAVQCSVNVSRDRQTVSFYLSSCAHRMPREQMRIRRKMGT
jgi:hypothetical protein